jgi:uncharacterized oxidoreductase
MAPAPVLVAAPRLEAIVAAIFEAAGCDGAEASRISRHLLGANLAGHDSHGVARVPRYVEWLEAGFVLKGQSVETVTDGGCFALLDGGFGFGQTVAPQAVELGIARAQQHGIAVVGLRNAGHIGRVGDYAETAIRAGLISVHFVNVAGSVLVAPFGGHGAPLLHRALLGRRAAARPARWCWTSPPAWSRRARCWSPRTAASRCRPMR